MDPRLKHIVEHYDAMKIGVDEPFKFHCTQCGKCCINREDILLTPRDVYNIAKELDLTPDKMVAQYCETYIGDSSRVPIVRLRPRGSVKRCPLLKDRKCSVHKVKPTVCAMFPIGRCIVVDPEHYGKEPFKASQTEFIFTNPGCGDDSETHTVREWLGEFGIPLDDAFFVEWQTSIAQIGSILHSLEKRISIELMQKIWSVTFVALYLDYDTEKDFQPNFELNASKLLVLLNALAGTEKGGSQHV